MYTDCSRRDDVSLSQKKSLYFICFLYFNQEIGWEANEKASEKVALYFSELSVDRIISLGLMKQKELYEAAYYETYKARFRLKMNKDLRKNYDGYEGKFAAYITSCIKQADDSESELRLILSNMRKQIDSSKRAFAGKRFWMSVKRGTSSKRSLWGK
jgi:hypothetical protein